VTLTGLSHDTKCHSLFVVLCLLTRCGHVQTAARLRGVLPIVVDADFWEDIGETLDDIFIPDAEIW